MARRITLGILLLGALAFGIGDASGHDRDLLRIHGLRPAGPPPQFPAGENVPVFPAFAQEPAQDDRPRAETLQLQTKLELRRFVEFEFAKAVKTIPGGKNGFRYRAGEPVDEQSLRNATASSMPAANPGDMVQITRLEFKNNQIIVDINGGGKKRKSWRERIQISGGGVPTVSSTSTTSQQSGPAGFTGIGSTLILEYGKAVPDLTVAELKQHLSIFLDFDGHRSAAVNWIETLPPEFQEAIKEKRAVLGMDREMVVIAMGKPEKKVREKDLDGLETEDWIYGHPPGRTVFVKFAGDKVVSVKEFPN